MSEMTNDIAADPGIQMLDDPVVYATPPEDTVQADPEFIDAYSIASGELVRIPAHYRDNPVLWAGFRKTPLTPQQQRDAEARVAAASRDETPSAGEKE